jgi:hypothetical protein
VLPREGHGGTDPQAAGQACAGAAGDQFRFVGLLDGSLGTIVKILPGLGRRQAMRGADHQAHAEAAFQLRHGLGHRGLANLQHPRRGREGPGLDDTDKGFHRGQPVHPHSSQE